MLQTDHIDEDIHIHQTPTDPTYVLTVLFIRPRQLITSPFLLAVAAVPLLRFLPQLAWVAR